MDVLILDFLPDQLLALLLVSLIHLLGAGTSLHAIVRSRTPQGAVAWGVSLVTFPYIALPVYLLIGRNRFEGYVLARLSALEHINRQLRETGHDVVSDARALGLPDTSIAAMERLARVPGTGGNRAELLVNGEATFNSIFEGIDAARHYILLQFYIIRDDHIGQTLKSRLIERASAGVRVLVLYDEIGSFALSSAWIEELQSAGVRISPFPSGKGPLNRWQLNFRNHRKVVVVDGTVAWVGGHNVGDEYLGRHPDIGPWRDTNLRIEGPATIPLQLSFVEDWHWATDELLTSLNWQPVQRDGGTTGILIVPSGPADPLETSNLMFMLAINTAVSRLWISSPYFVPDEGIIAALQLAALRGVDVRIMIPDNPDHKMVALATYALFEEVHQAGVRFYRYTEGFLHQKVMLVDDVFAAVGTANFDNRSFRLNFEITALLMNPELVHEVENMLVGDFRCCRKMSGDEFRCMPVWFRMAASVSRLFSPVL